MPQKRVILWTAPRCVSTAFERSIMNLKHSKIFHEPYSLPFYFGPERQSQRYGQQSIDPQATYRSTSKLLQKEYDGADLVFSKDMAYYVHKNFEIFLDDGFKNVKHTFLIRHPKRAVFSLYKASTNPRLTGWDYFDPVEAGFQQMNELYQFVRARLDPKPVVIDADDLLVNPEGIMHSYCEALGLSYQENMTRWSPGPVPEWDTWAGWHEDALKSSGFIPRKNRVRNQGGGALNTADMPTEVLDSIKMSIPHFEALFEKRIHARKTLSDVVEYYDNVVKISR